MIILIDNYDSFTYNLYHYLQEVGQSVQVYRNDAITAKAVIQQRPDRIVISPGPCDPDKAGISLELIKLAANNAIPLLGVCLGHQAIAQAYGGKVIRADVPMHGKVSDVYHGKGINANLTNRKTIFDGLATPLKCTRYHSLVVERASIPDCLEITAQTQDKTIMGIQHKEHNIHGVQFHPESIASEGGHDILRNFCNM